jgi:hypothetical protein
MLPRGAHAPFVTGNYALNSLNSQQQQVSFFLGHSLRRLYEDVLKAPVPVYLQAIAARLKPRTTAEVRTQGKRLPERES